MLRPSITEILASVFFGLAIVHTFSIKRFAHWAHQSTPGSIRENVLHFLAETEVVFGLWATALFVAITALKGSFHEAVEYIESLNYTEAKFVFVVMAVAATRPVVCIADSILLMLSKCLPFPRGLSFYFAALAFGPLLGSFITEPAAMTLLALVLKKSHFEAEITPRFAYATLGLLFVNVSIGGTLTNFAAPPVLMVAAKWNWGSKFMLLNFGWRAAASCMISTSIATAIFRKELARLAPVSLKREFVPKWLTFLHLLSLGLVVFFAHHPDVFFGVFILFLGMATATKEYQDELKLREALLVGFFLAGLVTLGSLQSYWLKPLIQSLSGSSLFFGATALTALTDNAALTYLGSLADGISEELKYALVAGAVSGGGLTVIANAPNPAGFGILQDARVFHSEGISPWRLFFGALIPTTISVLIFWCIR